MSTQKQKQVVLDITRCQFDENGVTPFWWPFRQDDFRNFANEAMHIFADTLSKYSEDDPVALHPYRIMSKLFIVELVSAFQVDAIFQRAQEQNVTLVTKENTRFFSYKQKQKDYNQGDILDLLRSGPEKSNLIKKIINFRQSFQIIKQILSSNQSKSTGLAVDGLKITPITKDILKNHVITTERYNLLARHAKEVEKDVYFCRSFKWFHSVSSQEEKNSLKNSHSNFETDILNALKDLFQKYQTNMSPQAEKYITDLLANGAAIMRVHYNRLIADKDDLPREVWTGSGGNIWNSTLRIAVRECGGHSCGHDHATGSGHFKMTSVSFLELWGCNEFYTFNKTKADGFAVVTHDTPFLENQKPKITHPQNCLAQTDVKKFKPSDDKKRVIFLSTPYDGDWGRLSPNMPDIVRVDFQKRVLDFLSNQGYEVILKLHPECLYGPHPDITKTNNATLSTDNFSEILEDGDIVLFDYIFTSTFRETLETNLPIIVIESVNFYLTEEAREDLEKRCAFLGAHYKENNSIDIDWDNFLETFKLCLEKTDNHDFRQKFLS